MRKSRFTEEQIAYAVRQAEQGTPAAEICRKMGISEQTFYQWKKKFVRQVLGPEAVAGWEERKEEERALRYRDAHVTNVKRPKPHPDTDRLDDPMSF